MQETLFDIKGNAVAYIDHDDEDIIYLWDGTPVAYLDYENNVYGFNGKQLGWFEDGIIWNLDGEKNGFNKNAIAVPVFVNNEPGKSSKKFKPFRSSKESARSRPGKKPVESHYSLSPFLTRGIRFSARA